MIIEDKKHQKLLIASISLAGFMSTLDSYIVNVSLPAISHYFNTGTGEVSRVIIAYLLFFTSTLLVWGKLGDKIGFKKLFIAGFITFTFGSLLCGISPSISFLVASRCIQGIGAAMLATSGFALISKLLPAEITGWAFGIYSTASAIGVAAGAPLGGIITGVLSWRWIFLINIPVGILAVILSNKIIPNDKQLDINLSKQPKEFDFLGAILSFLGLTIFLYAMNMGNELGWKSLVIILCLIFSLIFFVLFCIQELKHKQRLIDLSLFKNLNFTFAILAAFTGFMLMAGNAFLLPFFLKYIKQLKTEEIGMILMIYSIGFILVTPFVGRISDKVNPRILCSVSLFFCALASFVFSYLLSVQGLFSTIFFLIWLSVSYAFFISPNNKYIMSLANPEQKGMFSGIFNMTRNLSMVLGVSIMEIIFSYKIPPKLLSECPCKVHGDLSNIILISGFHNAYFTAGFILLISMVFSILAGKRNVKA